ncbi:MAG: heme-binding protein [Panacagrimonas sp.]
MSVRWIWAGLTTCLVLAAGCSGGGGGISQTGCTGSCQTAADRLEVADVERVIAQAVAEARARDEQAVIAVADRVGNVLAVFAMTSPEPANPIFSVGGGRGFVGGLDGIVLRNEGVLCPADFDPPDVIPPGLDCLTRSVEGPLFGTLGSGAGAIAKAVTGAYLSSEGNAFSTRVASQIIQEFFNPGETDQPGGPLFGVQFSSLPCSDLNLRFADGSAGPKRSPLGLAADPGGLPLYKNGVVVGGIGVIADGNYGADLTITDRDQDLDELIAVAGTIGFEPPVDRRADRITVDSKNFRYSDADRNDLASDPAAAPAFDTLLGPVGRLVAVPAYSGGASLLEGQIVAGTAFGFPGSGYRDADEMPAASVAFAGLDAFVLVDSAEQERFPPRPGTDTSMLGDVAPLSADEVIGVLRGGLGVANRGRAQIRRPLDSQIRVTISVVDTFGSILGVARTRDAPVFGTDVSLQKARSAMFFSSRFAADDLQETRDANYLTGGTVRFSDYVSATRDAFGRSSALADGGVAFGARSIGNLARPFFPDGLRGAPNGPISKPITQWSPFSTGIQLDLSNNTILRHVIFLLTQGGTPDVTPGTCTQMPDRFCDLPENLNTPSCRIAFCDRPGQTDPLCAGQLPARPRDIPPPSRLANGLQIFAGGVPIYRGDTLVGAIGISGDGIDQDDMIAFLGLHEGGLALGGSVGNAPTEIRADQFTPRGVRLRYVQCPQAPFLGSDEQRVCEGK